MHRRARKTLSRAQFLSCGDRDAASELLVVSVTQLARERLLRAGVFPGSRPELAGQSDSIGEHAVAQLLRTCLGDGDDIEARRELTAAGLGMSADRSGARHG